jgi:putative hydrolase of the HAD superfamily
MTNAQRWALEHMARHLGDPFHDSVTVDEARCEKPDPVFFGFARCVPLMQVIWPTLLGQ